MKRYTWINSQGEKVRATIKEFTAISGMTPSMARSLAAGCRFRLNGWCSTSKRAKRYRDRFLTKLVHTRSGESRIVGPSVKRLAEELSLCANELHKILTGKKIMYRSWCLEKSWLAANDGIAEKIAKN